MKIRELPIYEATYVRLLSKTMETGNTVTVYTAKTDIWSRPYECAVMWNGAFGSIGVVETQEEADEWFEQITKRFDKQATLYDQSRCYSNVKGGQENES